MFETIAIFIIIFSMVLIIARAIKGPTKPDRLLASNSFGTKTIILIMLIALFKEDNMYIDIAFLYVLVNFATTIGMLKYYQLKSFSKK